MSGFGGSVKLTGENEYRQALRSITQSLREVSSQLQLNTAKYDANDKSVQNLTKQEQDLNKIYKAQESEVNKLRSLYDSYGKKVQEQGKAHKELEQAYQKEKTELEKIAKQSGTTSKEYQTQKQKVEELEKALIKSRQENENSRNALSKMGTALNKAETDLIKTTKEMDNLGKETKDTSDQVKSVGDGFTVFKGILSNLATKAISTAVNGLKKLGSTVVEVGKQAISSYADYEQLAGGIESMFGGQEKGLEQINKVMELSKSAWKDLTMSENDYMQTFAATYPLMKNDIEDQNEAIMATNRIMTLNSDLANTFGYSMETASNAVNWALKGTFSYLDNLNIGIKGTKKGFLEAAQSVGYMIESVDELTSAEILDVLEKVANRYGVLGKTAAEAQSTIQGSVKMMKATWKNLLVSIASDNADISKSVNEFVKATLNASKNIIPRIKTVVDGFKKMANSIVNDVFPKLKKQIPELKPLIETFEWFIKHRTGVVNAIKAMVGAFALSKITSFTKGLTGLNTFIVKLTTSMLASTTATTADTVAKGANATATGILTAAQTALNAAFTANPIGMVVTATVALVGAFTLLGNQQRQVVEVNKKHKEEMEKLTGALDDYNEKMKETKEQQQEYIDSNMSEVSYYEDLANELKLITDENGRVKEGYEQRAAFITTTLKDALGIEISYTDGVISNYKSLESQINNVINAKRAQILLEANEAAYNEAKSQRVKLEETYADAIDATNRKQAEREAIIKHVADSFSLSTDEIKQFIREDNKIDAVRLIQYANSLGKLSGEYNNNVKILSTYSTNLEIASKNLEESQKVLDDTRKTYIQNQTTINDYENALINLKDKNYEAVLGIYEDTHNYIGKTDEETYKNYQKAINMQEDYLKQLEDNKTGYDEKHLQSEKELTKNTIQNLKDQQAQYKKVTEETLSDVQIIWSDGLDDQLSEITGSNVEFRDAGNGLVQAYMDGVAVGQPKTKEQMAKLAGDAIKEVSRQKTGAISAGEDLIDGINNGIGNQRKQSGVFGTIRTFGYNLLANLKASLQEKSPSKATKEMGQYLLEGLGLGIEDEEKGLLNQITNLGRNVLSAFDNSLIGNSLSVGLADQIRTGTFSSSGVSGAIQKAESQDYGYRNMVLAFQEALASMKIELDDEEAGRFVRRTVENAIYT